MKRDLPLERLEALGLVAVELDGDEDDDMRPEERQRHLGMVAADQPCRLEPAEPLPARRRRQVGPPRQRGLGDPALAREDGQDGDVAVVEAEAGHGPTVRRGVGACQLS